MMNDQSSGTPADDQYDDDTGQPGSYCIKLYVIDGQVQSVQVDEEHDGAPPAGQALPIDQALQQVRQLIEQGLAIPERTADEEAMDGYRSSARRNVVGINDIFTKG